MSDQFLAEIRIFGCTFAPIGWAMCNGQLLPLSQNTALFSLLGTTYGGDGRSNFALPNLQARAPMQFGQGAGLSLRDLGEQGGEQTVTLLTSTMPSHNHSALANTSGNQPSPQNNTWGGNALKGGKSLYQSGTAGSTQMAPTALSPTGGNLPHNNLPPYLVLNFCIALQGIYPARS
jgi:microcystin-dependent protein